MMRVVHPGSGSWIQGSKRRVQIPDPQHCFFIIIIVVVVGKYCGRPVPAYLELVGGADEEEGVGGPLDIKYHLLRLYADRSHSLESLLSPASHTPDQLDTRLSWLLYQV
jgi:hypothetical protein